MADVEVDLANTKPEDLVQVGIRAYYIRDFANAVAALSSAIESLAPERGEKHDSLASVYLYYGKSLLEFSREEAQPLGDNVPRKLRPGSDDEDDEEEDDDDEVSAVQEKDEATAADAPEEPKTECTETAQGEGAAEEVTPGKVEGEASTSGTAGTAAAPAPEEDPTDLQVAWEVLELAKMIFESRGATAQDDVAETLIVLGEVSMESENFEEAVNDITKGLEILKTTCRPDSRVLAETHYKLGMALCTAARIDDAIESFTMALNVLRKRLENLKTQPNVQDEIKDIEGLIPEIEEKIADMNSVKEEKSNELLQAVNCKLNSASIDTKANGVESSSSSKGVNDISHLVKRKRKAEDENNDQEMKKSSVD